MKVCAQEREYVKNVDMIVLTPCKQFKPASCNGDFSADSRLYAAWKRKKEILKIKYTQHIPFPEVRKIVETTLLAWSYSRVTQPIQNPSTLECHKCNLLIEKLLHLKPDFPTLLKELQASIPQPPNPPFRTRAKGKPPTTDQQS